MGPIEHRKNKNAVLYIYKETGQICSGLAGRGTKIIEMRMRLNGTMSTREVCTDYEWEGCCCYSWLKTRSKGKGGGLGITSFLHTKGQSK